MMKVIFFDKHRSTYTSVENVVEVRSEWSLDISDVSAIISVDTGC